MLVGVSSSSLASCASVHFGMDDSFHLRFVFRLEKDNYWPVNEFRFVSFFVCIDAPNAHWTRHYCGVMAATQNFNFIFARFLSGTGPQIGFTTISFFFFFFFTQFLNLYFSQLQFDHHQQTASKQLETRATSKTHGPQHEHRTKHTIFNLTIFAYIAHRSELEEEKANRRESLLLLFVCRRFSLHSFRSYFVAYSDYGRA